MNKSIIVGLIALGLVACTDDGVVEDQPTDAVTVETPAADVVEESTVDESTVEVVDANSDIR
jgi:hypothetical protein